jgi:hypothetical protein
VTGRTGGHALIAVGAFLGLGIVLNLGQGYGWLAYSVALSFFCGLPVVLGVVMSRTRSKNAQLGSDSAWEPELLRLATQRGGSLTVAEAVAYCDLSRADAEQRLDELCKAGLAEVRVSPDGVLVYRFEGFLNSEEKRRAKGVLDA